MGQIRPLEELPAEHGVIQPDDEYNRRLIAQVHPHDWISPTPKARYHLVVNGAGTAGLVTAAAAAGLGAAWRMVERHLMGGDCLNAGCVPSKALLSARPESFAIAGELIGCTRSSAWKRAGRFRGHHGTNATDPRRSPAAHDSAARFRNLGVNVASWRRSICFARPRAGGRP